MHVNILELSDDAVLLATDYMNMGAIPRSEPEDAYHIAIASVNRLDSLASWNFDSPCKIVQVNKINRLHLTS